MERLTGKQVAEQLANFMNRADRNEIDEFINTLTKKEHRTLQQQVFSLFIDTIFEWANTKENWYDLRNEYTVKTSKKIKEVVEYRGVPFI